MKEEGAVVKILIVGGAIAGTSAAARLRRLDEQAEIILFEKGTDLAVARCGLPYYLGQAVDESSLRQSAQHFADAYAVDVRLSLIHI